jgi:1-acyl-sn-glycerol-3-phosphate acyltransferase
MSLANTVVSTTIKGLTRILCRIDASQLNQVPQQGPLLLVANHINFLDAPVVYTQLQPRPVTGFVKAETWENPVMGLLFNVWGGIPIRRGEPDLAAPGEDRGGSARRDAQRRRAPAARLPGHCSAGDAQQGAAAADCVLRRRELPR